MQRMILKLVAATWVGVLCCAALGDNIVKIENKAFRLEFDVTGKPKSLFRLADGKELLHAADPGRGFFLNGMNFAGGEPVAFELTDLALDGTTLTARRGFAVLTFSVDVQDNYVAFSLERAEGVPTANLQTLRFEINVAERIALHPLDHMTYRRNCYGATDCRRYSETPLKGGWETRRVFWNWLWDLLNMVIFLHKGVHG